MSKKSDNYFKTQHLNLSSALLCWGFKLKAIDRNPADRRATFVFQRTEELDQAIQGFWSKELTIIPIDYYQAERELKSRLYDQRV